MRPNSIWVIIVWLIPRHLILKAPQVKCFMFMLHKRQWSAIYNDRICLCLGGGGISIFRNQVIKKELLSNLLTGTSLLKGARCLILLRRKYYSSLNDLISLLFDNFRDELLSDSRSSSRLRNLRHCCWGPFLPRGFTLGLDDTRAACWALPFGVLMAICHLFAAAAPLPRVNFLKLCCPCNSDFQLVSRGAFHLGPDHSLRRSCLRVSFAVKRQLWPRKLS